MTSLLILTNSADGTCDALARILNDNGQHFFRWNIDMWSQYTIGFDGDAFHFVDPVGRFLDAAAEDVLLLWRKPFTALMTFDDMPLADGDREQARSQMGQWLYALVATMKPSGRVRLIEPYADRRLPKLHQLREARTFFTVPRSHFGVQAGPADFGPTVVIKPLGDPSVGSDNIFYTSCVDDRQLIRPYPWFMQEALVNGRDVTCVYIHGCCHFYECGFARNEQAIDWRMEINTEGQSSWNMLKHPRLSDWQDAVNRYMKHFGLHYGRLDFILQGDTLYFLECNSNGQFGWLDDVTTLKLHREFVTAALDPATIVRF